MSHCTRPSWTVVAALGIAHVAYAPYATSVAIRSSIASALANEARVAWVLDRSSPGTTVNVLGADLDYSLPIFPLYGSRAPKAVQILSYARSGVSIRRIDRRSIEVLAADEPLIPSGREFRNFEALQRLGSTVDLPGLKIGVLEVRPDGSPQRIRYEYDRDIDDKSMRWVVESRSGFRELNVPPVGRVTSLDL